VRAHRRAIEPIFAAGFYLSFACYLTWPLVIHLSHSIYGATGDPYGTMAFYRELMEHHYNPFLPGTISQFGAPLGIPVPWPRDLASAPGIFTLYSLTALFGAIPAFGLYTLAGYTLTGVATFLLARRLTGNTWAALLAGWAFAFYPFAAINGQAHLDFVQGWLFVLAAWRMLALMWQPTRRNGLLAGAAVVLCMWWSPYFILFGAVLYVAMAIVALIVAWHEARLRAMLAAQSIAVLVLCIFVAGLGALATTGETEGIGVRTHTNIELNYYAARPLEYIVPDVESPLLGGKTRPFLAKYPTAGAGMDSTLYVGITILLLAMVAIVRSFSRKLDTRLRHGTQALAAVAIVSLIASMPPEPHVFGIAIPFPSHFLAYITTTWRVYTRFVMLIMLACTLLAAVGLSVLSKARRPSLRIGIMVAASIAIPLDLWAPQHGHVHTITTPRIYQTLARQPMGLVAEYPLAGYGLNKYGDIFRQSAYKKPMLGGFLEESPQERIVFSLASLSNSSTASRLATLGVRYVLVDATPRSWGYWPAEGMPGAGFRLIAQESYANLYLVTARPQSPALVGAGEGFSYTFFEEGKEANLLEQPAGTIGLTSGCVSCEVDGVLSMVLASYRYYHQVTFTGSRGEILDRIVVGKKTRVAIPLRFRGHATVRLTATPAPIPLGPREASAKVSVAVVGLEFKRAAAP